MHAATYLLISVITVIILNYLCLSDPVFMCYYPSKARLRTNVAKFEIADINFTLCTHYIYVSGHINSVSRTIVPKDPQAEEGPNGLYREFVDAKNNFTSIKTLLSVGDDDGYSYSQFTAIGENVTILSNFVTSAVAFLRQHGFDGLEINAPYVYNGSRTAHSNLLKALREKFDEDTNDRLILTATCPAIEMYIDRGYDVVSMAKSVDYAILATHDLFTGTLQLAQFNSPLFSSRTDNPHSTLSVNYSLHAWNRRGLPFNKMVLGFTGRSRMKELANLSDYEPWAPITNSYFYGHFYYISYVLTYIENCRIYNDSQKYYDDVQKSPYIVYKNLWIGYDDVESLDLKIRWVLKRGVAGVMFSSLDEDDFMGTWCGKGKFPLVVAMKNAITRFMSETEDAELNSNSTMAVGNATDGNDTIARDTALKDTAEEDTGIISNLLYGFLFVLIPIVCLAIFFLCGGKGRQEAEE